jgi:hypothetical protein
MDLTSAQEIGQVAVALGLRPRGSMRSCDTLGRLRDANTREIALGRSTAIGSTDVLFEAGGSFHGTVQIFMLAAF